MKYVELGKVADVNWGDTSVTKASYVEDGYPAFSATGSDGLLPYFDFDREGIVLSAIGARCGKTWFATGKWSVIKNTIRFWSESSELNNRYLYWLTADPEFWPKRGAAQPFITIGDARKLKIPLPPLEEQKRIAAILDQADELRRKRQRALDRLGQLGQAIFIEMFGDPATNTMGWPHIALVDCCAQLDDIRCGPFGTQLLREEFQETGVPLWGIKQVNRGFSILTHEYVTPNKARELSNYDIVEDDIVMTRKGTIGNCAVYPKGFPSGIMHSDLLRVRLDRAKAMPQFIADQLHFSRDIQRQIELISGGAIMQGINVGKLKKIKILLPPLALQVTYAERITVLGIQASSMKKCLHSAEALFTSLQHRAFNGDLTTSSLKEAAP